MKCLTSGVLVLSNSSASIQACAWNASRRSRFTKTRDSHLPGFCGVHRCFHWILNTHKILCFSHRQNIIFVLFLFLSGGTRCTVGNQTDPSTTVILTHEVTSGHRGSGGVFAPTVVHQKTTHAHRCHSPQGADGASKVVP
jgi:hypothetical protein